MGRLLLNSFGRLGVRWRTWRVATSISSISKLDPVFGLVMYAICLLSGDHVGSSSPLSGETVKFTTSPVFGETRNTSHCSSPSWSEMYAIHVPSGDQAGCACRWSLMVNCIGHPPVAGTSQRLLRPLMLEMNAICLPSGDHVVPPTSRVM